MTRQIIIFALILFAQTVSGQDLHFSQYNENPSLVNPALTGALGEMRASLVFKDQWRSVAVPYQTYGVTADKRFEITSSGASKKSISRLGAGLAVYNDKSGDVGFAQTRGLFSLAGFVQTGPKSFLSAGLQAGVVQRRMIQDKLLFSSQYNGSFHDPSLASGEAFGAPTFIHGEFAAGMLWSYAQDESRIALNDHVRANVGLSVYRLNRPSSRFLAVSARSPVRFVAHGDFLFCQAQSNVGYAPSFLLQVMGKSYELIAGGLVKYYYNTSSKYTGLVKRPSTNFGLHYRNRDAVIATFQYELEDTYAIGLSYDINVSRLTAATSARGGFELSFRYIQPKKAIIPVSRH